MLERINPQTQSSKTNLLDLLQEDTICHEPEFGLCCCVTLISDLVGNYTAMKTTLLSCNMYLYVLIKVHI